MAKEGNEKTFNFEEQKLKLKGKTLVLLLF